MTTVKVAQSEVFAPRVSIVVLLPLYGHVRDEREELNDEIHGPEFNRRLINSLPRDSEVASYGGLRLLFQQL